MIESPITEPGLTSAQAAALLGERTTFLGAVGVALGLGGVVYGTLLGHRAGARSGAGPALAEGELPPVNPA